MSVTYVASGEAAVLLSEIEGKIAKVGGRATREGAAGTFEVQGFAGGYRAVEGGVEITVTKKPMMVPDSLILGWLKENLA